ncbi:MAG: hypothetical protein US67_C0027G0005 [Candidatus Woesebacteria bacterium GW2011_GWD1_38_10]|uniref:Uncharacterized protein n=2 Tax=Candidatus Woeseibacteriota TaxID=1752722 RepID=A0A0G0L0E9_9BACT|nr:MAG: hypothetical protein US67_C0027G0005 [Candidatus Woesebacteria bacterium GW2011_GWD1_38_10]KKQ75984.1 MAG: hypothetical protein US97_C0028G0002 [Microgenomates group bacterium GW2011_GWF1_38_5]KKQ84482.1 MAG: hypothetical protein UT06_C0004G0018 [Candidatus Woesebacteria bacterium GW2011_GWA1_38_8]
MGYERTKGKHEKHSWALFFQPFLWRSKEMVNVFLRKAKLVSQNQAIEDMCGQYLWFFESQL